MRMDDPSILDWLKENISSPRKIFEALRSSLRSSEEGEARRERESSLQANQIDVPKPGGLPPEPISEQTSEEVTREPEPVPTAGGELTESHAGGTSAPEETPPSPPEPSTDRPLEREETHEPRSGRVAEVQFSIQVPIGSRVKLTVDAVRREDGEASIEISENDDLQEPTEIRILSAQSQTPAQVPSSLSSTRRIQTPSPGERISLPTIPFGDVWAGMKGHLRARGISITLGTSLFVLGGIIYMITRLASLDQFPIYFFADEAYQVVFAERLIENNFWSPNELGIPVYIEAAGLRWTPMISTYFHALSILLAGKSVVVARTTSTLVGLLGVVAVSLTLKRVFKQRTWWVATIFLAAVPAWFLHSRTTFETVMTSAFYACFLYCYLRYRHAEPRYLYPAIAFAALTFYSYSIAQVIMGMAALMLFISDWQYHWENRQTLLRGIPLLVIFAVPFIIFRIKEPEAIGTHLRAVDSYLLQDITLGQKITQFLSRYLNGLSPLYWFFPNSKDLIRHQMVGYGHFPTWSLPFALIGLVIALRKIHDSRYRGVILAMLAVPFGAGMLDVTITRTLAFILPTSIIISFGLDWGMQQAERWLSPRIISFGTFTILGALSIIMFRTALVKGPLWSDDYGLYGMQYGAKQLFAEAIPEYWDSDPEIQFHVSSTWANGTNHFLDFFLDGDRRTKVQISGIDDYLTEKREISENDLFVLTQPEYQKAAESSKLKEIDVDRVISYPDGNPGFYFVHLEYVEVIDEILAAERLERQQPLEGEVEIDGQSVEVVYSRTDMGNLADLFDDDEFTLLRGLEANPFKLEFTFPEPQPITGIYGFFGMMDYEIAVDAYADLESDPVHYEISESNVQVEPQIEIQFDQGPQMIQRVELSIENLLSGDTAHIHIRELDFLY
jgi:4-amino-4-deoxy-L-arabinose transferase-like glycosyltransferase